MQVYTFQAESVQAALQQVRQKLGHNASILHTRERRHSRLGFFSRTTVEVDATVGIEITRDFETSWKSARKTEPQLTTAAPQPTTILATKVVSESDSSQTNSNHSVAQSTNPVDASSATIQHRERILPAMIEVHADLLDAGLPPTVARELLKEAGESCLESQLCDPSQIRVRLSQLIAAKLRVAGSIELQNGQQQIVALVGPTGAGKTTTLAKIAAGFRFELGCQIGIIALDTFRLGAVDQLLQYAEQVSAQLEVVSSPEQVTPALQRLRECDLVLLDTAGRSPRDQPQLAVLGEFLQHAEPHSTQLVISATSSLEHARETMEQFSILKPTNLLMTKLDEVTRFGSWLEFLAGDALPISYLTAGQHVPQDILVASPRRLASLLLGGKSLNSPQQLSN